VTEKKQLHPPKLAIKDDKINAQQRMKNQEGRNRIETKIRRKKGLRRLSD
jgi:hypothetical protein